MEAFSSVKKGLLLKSFFICTLLSSQFVSARTLIFQSKEDAQSVLQNNPPSSGQAQVATNQVGNSAPAASVSSELFFMVEQLTQEVMTLRGLVEEQGYMLSQLQSAGKDRYAEIDRRLLDLTQRVSVLESSTGSSGRVLSDAKPSVKPSSAQSVPLSGGGSTVVPESSIASEVVPVVTVAAREGVTESQKVEYQRAYNFVKEKDFPKAIDALHEYVEKYPDGDLTGNAFYWLGEVYLALPKLEQAKQAFTIVVKTFPGHRKLADAMYKLAVAHDRLQEPAEAEVYLKRVQEEYPSSTAARLARNYALER
jgi:tol-pal system protein YbgF